MNHMGLQKQEEKKRHYADEFEDLFSVSPGEQKNILRKRAQKLSVVRQEKEEREKFLSLLYQNKDKINKRIARSSRHGEFFSWLSNKLNKEKENWEGARISPTKGLPHWEQPEKTFKAMGAFWSEG